MARARRRARRVVGRRPAAGRAASSGASCAATGSLGHGVRRQLGAGASAASGAALRPACGVGGSSNNGSVGWFGIAAIMANAPRRGRGSPRPAAGTAGERVSRPFERRLGVAQVVLAGTSGRRCVRTSSTASTCSPAEPVAHAHAWRCRRSAGPACASKLSKRRVQVEAVGRERLLGRGEERPEAFERSVHAECRRSLPATRCPCCCAAVVSSAIAPRARLRVRQRRLRGPAAQRGDGLRVVVAFGRAVVAFVADVLRRRTRRARSRPSAVRRAAFANWRSKRALQSGARVGSRRRGEHRGQAVVERQFVERPAAAPGAPRGFEARVQRGRNRDGGEAGGVVRAQAFDERAHRLRRALGRRVGGGGALAHAASSAAATTEAVRRGTSIDRIGMARIIAHPRQRKGGRGLLQSPVEPEDIGCGMAPGEPGCPQASPAAVPDAIPELWWRKPLI